MRTVDRIFGWLMVAGALYFAVASIRHPGVDHPSLLLASGAALGELLLATVNLVRAERRHDLVLARICVFGNLGCLSLTALYARMLYPPLDPILLLQTCVLAGLLLLSMRSRKRSRPM